MFLSLKIKPLLLGISILISAIVMGQNIPNHRITDWTNAGSKCIDNSADTVFLNQLGTSGDVNLYFDSLFNTAQDSLVTLGGGTIIIPSGTFSIDTSLRIQSNITIQGQGYLHTILEFNLNGTNADPIIIQGSNASAYDTLVSAPQKGDDSFIVSDASLYQIGQSIKIIEDDDGRIFSSWSSNNIGQIFTIDSINTATNIIFTTHPSRLNFDNSLFPRFQTFVPKRNIKICGLKIDRLDATATQTSNIYFRLAENCTVEGIESNNSNFAHLEINISKDISIENCYFHHAHNYGGGGQGYGVVIQATSGDVLVQNNIFNHLRHSILLQSCANGNVISYNYSIDPFWTGVALPSNSAGDIVLHGNYPFLNLFEGNVCQNIVIDNSHGINGHHNTFLRNRAELYGLFMNSSPASDSQNFIGNEIPNTTLFQGLYTLEGTDHFVYGNNHKGTTKPSGTSSSIVNSFYLDGYPHFWSSNLSDFPTLGYPNTDMNGTIPSSINYSNSHLAECNNNDIELNGLICSYDSILIDGIWHSNDTIINSFILNGKCTIPLQYQLGKAEAITLDQNNEILTVNTTSASQFLWHYNGLENGNNTPQHIATQNGAFHCEVTLTGSNTIATCTSDTIEINGLSIDETNIYYKLFPNPGKDYFILELNQKGEVLLQSQLGEIIASYPINNQLKVNTEELSSGLYYLTIRLSDGTILNSKWIKQ